MTQLDRFTLDQRGLAFVREQLSEVNTYCSALASRVAGEAGSVFIIAPPGTSDERLYRFAEGGLLAPNRDKSLGVRVDDGWVMPIENLRVDQARLILEMLKVTPTRSCIVDDFNPEWGDVRRQFDLGQTAFGVGKEVYHWFDARHDRETIATTLRQADALWHGVSAVSECPPPSNEPPSREWLMDHATSAIAVFCSAYDGEGFVGWVSGQKPAGGD